MKTEILEIENRTSVKEDKLKTKIRSFLVEECNFDLKKSYELAELINAIKKMEDK